MRDYIVLAIIAGLVPLSVIRPFYGLLAWSWISYMAPHKLGWGVATYQPVAMMIGLAALVGFVVSREPKKIPAHPTVFWYFMFMFWMLLTFLVNIKSPDVFAQGDKILKIQLFIIISLMIVNTRERLNWLLAIIAFSIGFYGVKGGIFTITSGGGERVWGPPTTFIEGNNELGLAMLMVAPIMLYFASQVPKGWKRYALWACAFFTLVAVIGTHSRGALLALFAMLGIVWLRSRQKLVILILLVVALPTLFVLAPENWRDRMATMKTDESVQQSTQQAPKRMQNGDFCADLTAKMQQRDASFGGRVNAWCMATHLAGSEFFGGGYAAFSRSNFHTYAPDPEDYHDAHSIYFQILGEHGFVGLALFLAMIGSALLQAGKLRALTRNKPELEWAFSLAGMLQSCIVAFIVGGAFLGLAYFDLFYHLIVAVVALSIAIRKQESGTSVSADSPVATRPRFANSLPPRTPA